MYNNYVHAWGWVQQHRWLGVVILVIIVLGTAGGTCWAVFFRTVATPVSLRDALRMYRRDHADGSTRSQALLSPGVFSYATSGGEGLNLVGVARSFPSRTNMVVTSRSGGSCSTVDWVPIVEHSETTSVCASAKHSLAVSDLISHETIGGSTTTTVITCPVTTYLVPPITMPGVRWTATCHEVSPSENVTVAGLVLGSAPMDVQRQAISTLHVRLSFTFVGIDQGLSPVDFWISTGRGLIVREQEVAHIAQQGVHYTEQMDSRLTTLTPAD